MRELLTAIQIILISTVGFCGEPPRAPKTIEIEVAEQTVGKYQKLELNIRVNSEHDNPFDTDQIDVSVLLRTPNNKQITLPAFYCQDYERRKFDHGRNRANWYYPTGRGTWKARFAPGQTGIYSAAARLRDRAGTAQSQNIRFDCIPSSGKGFLRTSRKDPRFLEFSDGTPFFAMGQNLAFIGEGQYVNLTKAEEIFEKLSQNGANFLRIWTCCQDWAMAIEAKKSAWDRSWGGKAPIVQIPGGPDGRKCVKLEGSDGASIDVSPSHPVALRPKTRYVLGGRLRANGPTAVRVSLGSNDWQVALDGGSESQWKTFEREFITGENEWWLNRMAIRTVGGGTVWLDKLSLKEAGGSAELLWEADVNRPLRGHYNQLDCFMLDKLVEAAESNGIYLMLCVITRDLYMKSLSDENSAEYQQAISDSKKLMRYAAARWGYSTNVAAWEYFNEIDPGLPTDRFYAEVGKYLEQIDVHHHLRATSTWHPSAKDCRHPQLDIGQLHHYMRPETKEDFKDEVAVVLDRARFLRTHGPGKPVLIGEFGLATAKWGLSDYMKQDGKGVHFHNSLWASAFAGTSGTAMFWWWDQLDRQDAYGHYRPLAGFLADVSFAGLQEVKATVSNDQLRLLGYQGSDVAYIWISDSQATWYNLVVDKKEPAPVSGATIDIQGLQPGSYRIEWWDTHKGKVIRKQDVSLMEGPLHIPVPSFSRDIACKIGP